MIRPGRPIDGYSDIENMFYTLNVEIDNIFSILKINIRNTLENYESETQKLKGLEDQFYQIVHQFTEKYVNEGEDPEIASSIAKCDAQYMYNICDYSFEDQYSNSELLKKSTIDSLCKSTMVMLYSNIEYFMIKICAKLKDELSIKIDLNDLYGSGYINKCFLYFDKVINIGYDKKEYKNKFKEFQLIRNQIVHSNSSIIKKENNVKIFEIVNRDNSDLSIEENRFLFDNIGFVELFLKSSKKLLNSLESNIDMKLNFPSLLHELKCKLYSSKILRDNEIINVIDNKLTYYASISEYDKNSYNRISITIEVSEISSNDLIIEKKTDYLMGEDLDKYFKDTQQSVRSSFKKYMNLINGKENFSYTMRIS